MQAAMEDPAKKERAARLLATIWHAENRGIGGPAVAELLSLEEPAAVLTAAWEGWTTEKQREAALAKLRLRVKDLTFLLDWMVEDALQPLDHFGSISILAGTARMLDQMAHEANEAMGTRGMPSELVGEPGNHASAYDPDRIKRWAGIQLASALTSSGWSEEERQTLEELQRKFPAGPKPGTAGAGQSQPGATSSPAADPSPAVAVAPSRLPAWLVWSLGAVVAAVLGWVVLKRRAKA